MNISNLSVAVLSFVESNILPQIPNSLMRWGTYAILLAKMPQLEQQVIQFMPTLKEIGAADDNNNIDISKLHPFGIAAFEKVPSIKIGDFEFDRNDFEKFMDFLGA
jgi:hypothetical protein